MVFKIAPYIHRRIAQEELELERERCAKIAQKGTHHADRCAAWNDERYEDCDCGKAAAIKEILNPPQSSGEKK